MLKELRIVNLAIVEDIQLAFGPGLNVLTGSTGAGKSLILSAVNLLFGRRYSGGALRKGAETAVVEGCFQIPRTPRGSTDAEAGGRTVLRREMQRGGRSSAYIDGKPSTLKELQSICATLIEPHGQNEQLRLRDPENHVVYIDAFAGCETLRTAYAKALREAEDARACLREFDQRIALVKEKRELLGHRIEEIQRARIERGEREKLDASLRILENAQKIFDALNTTCEIIYEGDAAAAPSIAQGIKQLAQVSSLDPKFKVFCEAMETAEITLKECAEEMRSYLGSFEFDPRRLEEMQERYAFLSGLERRYGKPLDQILDECKQWEQELDSLAFEGEERDRLKQRFEHKRAKLEQVALKLSASRKRAAKALDERMTGEMERLMMPGAKFRTVFSREEDPNSFLIMGGQPVRLHPHGTDKVEFFIQTNPGEAEGKLNETASSGEVSRIALALKKVANVGRETSTLVFDEIDAGVGADLGEVIARELKALSKRCQIICITHMPQIAAAGDTHLVVSKTGARGRTHVEVRAVEDRERLRELARMLGGREGSEKRLALAKEMLQKGNRRKGSIRVRP